MSTCALHSSAYLPQATSFALRLKWIHARRPRAGVQFWNRFRRLGLVSSKAPLRRNSLEERSVTLLKWALLFFVISIVAGILGFTGISAASADVARILFYIFLVIFLVLLILGLTIFRV
jgi:uncharacterized membrane protein YtjA (UPF0391 family)